MGRKEGKREKERRHQKLFRIFLMYFERQLISMNIWFLEKGAWILCLFLKK
jgi:hypothetical protein